MFSGIFMYLLRKDLIIMMTILYEVHNGLYVNMTNKCPCACTFCLRQEKDHVGNAPRLWLDREPTVEEVKAEFDKYDLSKYKEIVFCGFGEPTERLDDILEVCTYLKKKCSLPIRINTNGMADLINKRDTAPDFEGKIDVVSISLNTPDRDRFYELTRCKFGIESFDAMLRFAGEVKKYVKKVVLTTVATTITKEEEERCAKICEELGVDYRIRPFE